MSEHSWTDEQILEVCTELMKGAREDAIKQAGTGRPLEMMAYSFSKEGVTILNGWGLDINQFASAMRWHCGIAKPRGILVISEVWMVEESDPKKRAAIKQPSKHPDRFEAIYGALEDVHLGLRLWLGKIHRKPFSIDEPLPFLDKSEKPIRWEGTFTGLLSPDSVAPATTLVFNSRIESL